ncbi:unnamed protein product [Aphanomyces euteiches]
MLYLGEDNSAEILTAWLKEANRTRAPRTRSLMTSDLLDDDDLHDWLNITKANGATFCNPFLGSLVPCATDHLIPEVFKLITANPCCNDMASEIQQAVGISPQEFVTKLLSHAANIVCSIQTPGFHGAGNQTCGAAWMRSLNYHYNEGNVSFDRYQTMAQIPNDQGCAAALGDAITTANGFEMAHVFAKPVVPGSCVKPVDDLLTWLRQLPIAQTTWNGVTLRHFFDDGKCVNGSTINEAVAKAWTGDELLGFYLDIGMKPEELARLCVHFTNGGYGKCAFNETIQGAFPLAKDAITSTTTVTPSTTPKSSVGLATMSWFVSTMVVTSIGFW